MRNLVLRFSGLTCLLLAAACGDVPTQPDILAANAAITDEPAFNQTPQGCVTAKDGVCLLSPIVVDGGGGDPDCDMWWTPSCGECMTGTISGPDDMQGLAGCPDGGGTGGSIGSDPGGGGGGGSGSGGSTPPPPCPDDDCSSDPPAHAPEGVDQEHFESLNKEERRLCWANPIECLNVKSAADHATAWAAAQEGSGAHNGPQDAMRHAMWNARMTQMIGPERTKAWADAHESSSTVPAETRMDLHNNAAGRQVGSTYSDIGAGVWHYRNTGKLCLNVGSC